MKLNVACKFDFGQSQPWEFDFCWSTSLYTLSQFSSLAIYFGFKIYKCKTKFHSRVQIQFKYSKWKFWGKSFCLKPKLPFNSVQRVNFITSHQSMHHKIKISLQFHYKSSKNFNEGVVVYQPMIHYGAKNTLNIVDSYKECDVQA